MTWNNVILCPYCDKLLNVKSTNVEIQSIIIRKYRCKKCKENFERHTIYTSIGLVNSDTLLTEDFKDSWKGKL